MIVDLGESVPDSLPEYDLCVIGTGPAGATLLAELRDAGLRLCALESGRRRPDRAHDALRPVRSEGILVKDHSRERVLGGASTTWAGLSAPLDPIDLQPRPWLDAPGWPIGRDELLASWAAAAERYRFAPLPLFEPDGFPALRARGDWQGEWRELEEKVFLACSEPQDFGREQRALWEGREVDVYLDATVLRLSGADGRVTHAVLRTSSGRELSLRARAFVLATGGLENARLLLVSRDLCPAGLGNEHDQVGRWLMNHPKNYRGTIRLARPLRELPYYLGCLHRGYAGYAGLRLREDLQRQRGLLNCYVRLEPLYPWTDSRGVEALVSLVKRSRGLFSRWKEARREEVVSLRDWSETGDDSDLQAGRTGVLLLLRLLGLVLLHLPTVTRYAWSRLSHGRAPPIRAVRVRNFLEMQARPENRVTLTESRDPAGQPVSLVHHDSGPLDRRSLLDLQRVLGEEVRRSGLGELQSDLEHAQPWPIDQDASHHLGTTRMGADPRTSVVDRDLRLHSVANVWCAGGSVFPSSGCANPTFTIVALSIRLAQHLRAAVFGRAPAAAAPRRGPPPPAAPGAGPARRVLVIGAGRRVETDVLPALLACAGLWQVHRVLARGARKLDVAGTSMQVQPLDALTQADLDACDLVYLAVSKDAVPAALARLQRHDVSRVDLLVDTPVLLARHLAHRRRLLAFRHTWVAEDCSALPWFDALRAAGVAPTQAVFDRSAWRYHGLAMVKTVLGCRTIRAARRTRVPGGARVEIELANGARATIVEPRDYRAGHVRLSGPGGAVSDDPTAAGAALLRPVVEGGSCSGFACGDAFAPLDAAERWLFGPVQAGETVTSRTEDAKRVGLLRLLRDVHAGRGAWPLDEGLEDSFVDWLLEKRGRWKPGLLSVKSRAGMRFLALVTRPLG